MPSILNEQPKLSQLPHFVKAKTARGLQQAMLKEQRRLSSRLNWFGIQWVEGDKRWYAWYVIDIEDAQTENGS